MNSISADVDGFSVALETLLASSVDGVRENTGKAVAKAARKGAKVVKEKASSAGVHPWSDEYVGGFSSHVTRGEYTTGEIGNRAKPGLVHLLEKGHNTLNGRRTRAFPHMAPAFEEISRDFGEEVADAVEAGLRA